MIFRLLLGLVAFCFCLPFGVTANISKVLPDSIPYLASAGYAWSTWDFLTNPYLYHLQKDNAISTIITTPIDITQGDYLVAGRLSILNFPIFLTLGINQSGLLGSTENVENLTDEENLQTRLRILLGTNFGPKLWNLGVGVFYYYTRRYQKTLSRAGSGDSTSTTLKTTWYTGVGETIERLPTRYGIELGQKLAGKTNPAWTLSLEYRDWPGFYMHEEEGSSSGSNKIREIARSPFIKTPLAAKDVFRAKDTPFTAHNGFTRTEVAGNFLGWWPVFIGSAGLEAEFFVAFGSGIDARNTNLQKGTALPNNAGTVEDFDRRRLDTEPNTQKYFPRVDMKGYRAELTAFVDFDFKFWNDSVFRITPSLSYIDWDESLTENPPEQQVSDDEIAQAGAESPPRNLSREPNFESFRFRQQRVILKPSFKLMLNINQAKTFVLYLGWEPSFDAYNYIRSEQTDTGQARKTNIEVPNFRVNLESYFMGFTYRFCQSLNLHVRIAQEAGKFSVSSWDIGMDYIFTTTGSKITDVKATDSKN